MILRQRAAKIIGFIAGRKNMKPSLLYSPARGRAVPLGRVADEAFSSGMMGEGVGIIPADGSIYAPADCVVAAVFPTGHALALETAEGAAVLIHIGINTVQLQGWHFMQLCREGWPARKGDPLIAFDKYAIERAGYDSTILMTVINHDSFFSVTPVAVDEDIDRGREIIAINSTLQEKISGF